MKDIAVGNHLRPRTPFIVESLICLFWCANLTGGRADGLVLPSVELRLTAILSNETTSANQTAAFSHFFANAAGNAI